MFFKKSSTQPEEHAGRLLTELSYLIAMILLIGSIGLWPGAGTWISIDVTAYIAGHDSDQFCQPASRRERDAIDDRNNVVEV